MGSSQIKVCKHRCRFTLGVEGHCPLAEITNTFLYNVWVRARSLNSLYISITETWRFQTGKRRSRIQYSSHRSQSKIFFKYQCFGNHVKSALVLKFCWIRSHSSNKTCRLFGLISYGQFAKCGNVYNCFWPRPSPQSLRKRVSCVQNIIFLSLPKNHYIL